jgi:competence protein ComEC
LVVENTHSDKARELRDWFSDGIRKAIPEPEASLGIGYLVGQKSSLPESLQEQLRLVGLTHIVVASGYNLTILVRFARRLFASISKYLAMLSSSLMIVSFILVTGFSPSMTRAGLVTGLSLAAWYYGRKIHPMVLLPFAAAVTVFINPGFMWGDLGWYLSFSAFAGVMILAPLFQNYFFGSKKPGTIQQILGETISAQLTTLPIIAFSFGTLALFALPANLLVLPFVPLAMLLGFVAGILAVIIPLSVAFVGIPAFIVLTYMTSVIDWFSSIPNVSVDISFTIFGVIIFYAILLVVAIYMQRVTRHNFRKDNIVE